MIFENKTNQEKLAELRQSLIGSGHKISTPYGEKPLIYADYTASGRAMKPIEDYIQQEVLPFYANTHSESSYCGAATTRMREWARDVVKQSVHGRDNDCVIFCGSGTTAAISKWIKLLELEERDTRPVVFISPYEHHSNDLPWRSADVELKVVPLNCAGCIDLEQLQQALESIAEGRLVIGSFSAASNVTGIRTDVASINQLMKSYGALTGWDYAAAAPYVELDMSTGGGIDALFFSPHKFVGGPGTPGVLVVNGDSVGKQEPTTPGGGTVNFVSSSKVSWSKCLIAREEAGTPEIVGSIRAGLAMQAKQEIETDLIEACESRFIGMAIERLRQHPNINILGPLDHDRLAILSFQIINEEQELHYGLVVALLNDLFGIQARGGCSCAGPYGHLLLNIGDGESQSIDHAVQQGEILRRPGWTRLNFNYFIDDEEFEYIIDAILHIADRGWELASSYTVNDTGVWTNIATA